jgi:hypothetical protein
VLVIRIFAGSLDGERVERYIAEHNWQLIEKYWDPFGPGWFGDKSDRIYAIKYRDEIGNIHNAHVKTSMLSGVYLTNDEIVQYSDFNPQHHSPPETLHDENARLKAKIHELEQQLKNHM